MKPVSKSEIIAYYRDTSGPGQRGLGALKKEVIEERGLESSDITQFKHAARKL